MELELADCDLHQIVAKNPLNESETRIVAVQLCHALVYLHDEIGLVHRDIKTENVLVMKAFEHQVFSVKIW